MGKMFSKTAGLFMFGFKIYVYLYVYIYTASVDVCGQKKKHKQINKEVLRTGRIAGSLKIKKPKSRLSRTQKLASSRLGA